MTYETRTNPAYAFLAYRRAILEHTINHLLEDAIGVEGDAPMVQLVSPLVFREDERVPKDDIVAFVQELEEQLAEVKTQMGKFMFVRIDGDTGGTKRKGRGSRAKSAGPVRGTGPDGRSLQ